MTDRFSGIGNVRPTYPIKPVEPAGKDRPSGERRKKPPENPADADRNDDESREPVVRKKGNIDEYI
jgi:hypothetical protein